MLMVLLHVKWLCAGIAGIAAITVVTLLRYYDAIHETTMIAAPTESRLLWLP